LTKKMLPQEKWESSATQGGADGDAGASYRRPGGDGLGPLLGGEDGVQDGEGGRHHKRCPEAHEDPVKDEDPAVGGEGGGDAAEGEEHEAADQHPAAAVAVAHGPGRDQEGGEAEGVGVDDPLQGGGPGVQVAGQGGQCRVEHGVVDHHHQKAQAEHEQDQPASGVAAGSEGSVGAGRRAGWWAQQGGHPRVLSTYDR
jgi:hypothetical protein